MRSIILGGVAAVALATAAMAQSATNTPAMNPSATSGDFIAQQAPGMLRAPKLVGVAVYDSTNKDVGKISDLLLDKDGRITAVVISVGGFLGIGSKDVALPYSAIRWQTEQRTVATDQGPGSPIGGTTAAPTDKSMATPMAQPNNTKVVDAAQTEAYHGYPDRAVLTMTQAQLKAAPEFKYASNPEAMTPPAATPAQKP